MTKEIKLNPTQWILNECTEMGDDFKSIHFDSFENYEQENLKGIELFLYSAKILQEAKYIITQETEKRNARQIHPMIFLPLVATEEVIFWKNSYWNDIGNDFEPPELYLLPTWDPFDSFPQEYRTPIKLPIKDFTMKALFRSFRTSEALEHDWEFKNGIYLYPDDNIEKS